ncbi:MAG TPA: hypothetical protein PL069_02315, partial [Saprospiraceae bacterium]|nr:hypothetical protein [Saprospiraceae bacterium]
CLLMSLQASPISLSRAESSPVAAGNFRVSWIVNSSKVMSLRLEEAMFFYFIFYENEKFFAKLAKCIC